MTSEKHNKMFRYNVLKVNPAELQDEKEKGDEQTKTKRRGDEVFRSKVVSRKNTLF